MIFELVDYFLYAIPENIANIKEDFIPGDLGKRLTKIQLGRYVFNERILTVLLETDFFSNEFLKKDQP
jgi:hypothetical protein